MQMSVTTSHLPASALSFHLHHLLPSPCSIKIGLNSKMPSRFPPVVFYSPKEVRRLVHGVLAAHVVWQLC